MNDDLNLTGRITDDGKLVIYSQNETNDYLRRHRGKRIMIQFHVMDDRPVRAMIAYYHAKILSDIQAAFFNMGERKRLSAVDEFCREISPVCWSDAMDNSGRWQSRLKGISELSAAEMYQHIEFLKQYAAENFHVFIHDPKIISHG